MSTPSGKRVAEELLPPEGDAGLPRSQAPDESPKSAWKRRLILLAFWAVVAAFGLPHWIWTTSIHRANLPLESMNNWADGKACRLHYPIHVKLSDQTNGAGYLVDLAAQVQGLLNDETDVSFYKYHVSTDQNSIIASQAALSDDDDYKESALVINIQTNKKSKAPEASLRSLVPVLDVRHSPGKSIDVASLSAFITGEVRKIFSNEQIAVAHLLKDTPFAIEGVEAFISPEPEAEAASNSRSTKAFKYASTYHLTFSLFTSSAFPSSWDIEHAMEEVINPLLERMSSVSQFTVDTQVQLYASFSPSVAGPRYNLSSRLWQLERSDLSGFINAAEWPLSPSIGSGPTINFALYVPSKEQSPLVLAETGGNSWVIPQWGGVQILNPSGKQPERLTMNDLRPVMLTFADQLLSLLGVPQSPPSLSLRLSSLTREHATSLILSTSSTLGALGRLTLKLKSIAIPDSVSNSVTETIHRLDLACQQLREGHYQSALENARIAQREAEEAFFEPSMVGQVYFPEEHKVAVYVPLLGPMAVPLVLSLLKEIRNLRTKKTKVA